MSISAVTSHNLKLHQKSFEDLFRRQQKQQQDYQYFEAQKLRNFQEMSRLQRNRMHHEHYKDMELYEFQRKALTIQKDMLLNIGTNVDSYT